MNTSRGFSSTLLFMALSTFSLATSVVASERPAHFKGIEVATPAEAKQLLTEYNQKLALLVEKDQLSTEEVFEVHQLTYTLENALKKIPGDVTEVAAVLEEVHLASEKNDGVTVKARGKVYLEKVAALQF